MLFRSTGNFPLKSTFYKTYQNFSKFTALCLLGVRAAASRAGGASGECKLEIGNCGGADQHQGGKQRGAAGRAEKEASQQLKLPEHSGDSPGGGGLPHHQLLPHLLQWGARRDGDLEHSSCPEAQKSVRRSICGVPCTVYAVIFLPIW